MFLPAWNEARNLPHVVGTAITHLKSWNKPFDVIVVDDGSTDDTRAVLSQLGKQYPGLLTWVRHERNLGYGAAIRTGLGEGLRTGREWVGYCDADGQIAPQDITRLFAAAQTMGADIAVGYRRQRAENLHRRLMSHGWHRLSTLTLGFRAADVDCGIKLFHRRALDLLVPRLQGDHATISPEILALAHLARLSVTEVEVEHRPRSHGAPSGARPDVVVKSLKGLVALRKVLNEARVP